MYRSIMLKSKIGTPKGKNNYKGGYKGNLITAL